MVWFLFLYGPLVLQLQYERVNTAGILKQRMLQNHHFHPDIGSPLYDGV